MSIIREVMLHKYYKGKMAKVSNYQRLRRHFGNFNPSKSLSAKAERKDAPNNNNFDMIGPPDPLSNLRPIEYKSSKDETRLEKEYRHARESTQAWNKNFWSKHNRNFATERKEFQDSLKERTGKDSLTADEMSVFYKTFLDKNWRAHLEYNILWYKQNICILILEIKVRFSKMKFK